MDALEWFEGRLKPLLVPALDFEGFIEVLKKSLDEAPMGNLCKRELLEAVINPGHEEIEPGEAVERFFDDYYMVEDKEAVSLVYMDGKHRRVSVNFQGVDDGTL